MDDFYTFLVDQLAPLGPVIVRRMFGGAGLYLDGIMFGLVAEGTCYLKVDDTNRGDYEAQGMGPFVYDGQGKAMAMPYFEVPPSVLDSREDFSAWGRKSLAIARAAKAAKPTKKTPTAKKPTAKKPAQKAPAQKKA